MTTKYTTRHLAAAGLIAAAYVTLCAAFPALSYGPIQVRFSEVFTLLPVFSPVAIWGVGIGCMLANIYGLAVGTNIIGVWDILFGTAATVIAAVLTYRWRDIRFRGLPVLSALAPVLLNALIIGAELTAVMSPTFDLRVYLFNFGSTGLGEFIACFVIGLPVVRYLERSGIARRVFGTLTSRVSG